MQFDYKRLRFGETVAAGCAIVLFIDLFLSWYSVNVPKGAASAAAAFGLDTSASGWQAFSLTDLLLLLVIILALGLAFLRATERTPALPVAGSVILTALAGFATLIVLYRIVNQPGPNNLINVEYGAYLGFLLVAGIAYGGFLSMREEGTSFTEAKAQAEDMVGSRGTTTPAGGGAPPSTAPPSAAPPAAAPPATTPPAPSPPPTDPGEPGAPPSTG
jgi:hypothetical protein